MTRKTLHITNAYHPTSGGIRTFYRALLAAANQRERSMVLIVPGPVDDVEQVGRWGRIYYVRARPAPAFDNRYRLMWPLTYLPFARGRIVELLETEQPDLVEICDKYTVFYLAALLRRGWLPGVHRPTLVGLSCERMDDNIAAYTSGGALAHQFTRLYLRHIYGPPFDYHIANSDYTADELRRSLSDRAADFIHVCPMGVDVDHFGASQRDAALRHSLLERAGGSADSVLLLYAGRVSPEKNVELLVDALEVLARRTTAGEMGGRDYRLVIAGDGPQSESLERAAARLVPGRMLRVGSIDDRSALARHYASADVFVHPNPREPFGIGPLEAMASGVPVVLPDAGGVLSYASHTNAWLAAPNGEAFAEQIRAAVETPSPCRLAAARVTALAHRWDIVADQFFALYDRLDTTFRSRAPVA